jgi:hypothetical protein
MILQPRESLWENALLAAKELAAKEKGWRKNRHPIPLPKI